MRHVLMPVAALVLSTAALSVPAAAQSPFDGTWKADAASLSVTARPEKMMLKAGMYSCATCLPSPYTVKADGAFHAVPGREYWDDTSVTIVDPTTVKRQFRRAGKVVSEGTETVSADGMTLTSSYTNTNNAAGVPVAATTVTTRIGTAPAGTHAISGEWKAAAPSSVSDTGLQVTLKVAGGMLTMTSPQGETLNARIGGGYAPNVGDPGKTMTKVALGGPRTLLLTDMRGGKVVQTSSYTVSADGATLSGKWKDARDGAIGAFTARKQ